MSDKLILVPVPSPSKSWVREMLLTSACGSKGATFKKAWFDEWLDPPPQHWLRVQPPVRPANQSTSIQWFNADGGAWAQVSLPNHWPVQVPMHDVVEFKTWGPDKPRPSIREAMTAVIRAIEAAGYE